MQQTLAVRCSTAALLSRSWQRNATTVALRAFSSSSSSSSGKEAPNRSRGGLPRFHSHTLPSSKGEVVRVQGDEFRHMAKVLRLGLEDRVELFNGAGGVVEGCIQRVDQVGVDVMALEDPKLIAPQGIQWHIYAAFGTLKGGRSDWLIEKCTELGASSITPLLTARSPTIGDNRVDRLQRVMLAAVKQSVTWNDIEPTLEITQFSVHCGSVKDLSSSSSRGNSSYKYFILIMPSL